MIGAANTGGVLGCIISGARDDTGGMANFEASGMLVDDDDSNTVIGSGGSEGTGCAGDGTNVTDAAAPGTFAEANNRAAGGTGIHVAIEPKPAMKRGSGAANAGQGGSVSSTNDGATGGTGGGQQGLQEEVAEGQGREGSNRGELMPGDLTVSAVDCFFVCPVRNRIAMWGLVWLCLVRASFSICCGRIQWLSIFVTNLQIYPIPTRNAMAKLVAPPPGRLSLSPGCFTTAAEAALSASTVAQQQMPGGGADMHGFPALSHNEADLEAHGGVPYAGVFGELCACLPRRLASWLCFLA